MTAVGKELESNAENRRLTWLDRWIVTPRFHHWHHGVEKEAIDVNFAVHLPLFDRLFGTYHTPADGRWPEGYGIAGHPVPKGFCGQFAYPFRSKPSNEPKQEPSGAE